MTQKSFSLLRQIKIRIIVIVIMIILIIISLASLFYFSGSNSYEERVIVDVWGRQRMLTQMIAKEASHIYALIQARESGNIVEPIDIINSKINTAKSDMLSARSDFSKTLDGINSGYIQNEKAKIKFDSSNLNISSDLKQIKSMWAIFNQCINIILDSTNINNSFARSTIYINENNETLLKYCDNILKSIVDYAKTNSSKVMFISLFFVSVSLIITVILILSLYKYIIMPLDEIYTGFSEIGVYSPKAKTSMMTRKDIKPIVGEINGMFQKIEKLISLIENINNNLSFSEVLEFIFNSFTPFMPYNYIGLAIVKENGRLLEASFGISDGSIKGMPEGLLNKEFEVKGTSLEKILLTGETRIINDLEEYTTAHPIKEYTNVILNSGIRSSITLPLNINGKHIGIIFFSSKNKCIYKDQHINFLKVLANSIAISFEKNIFVDDLLYSSLLALAKLAEARDEDTAEHLERMKKYSRLIAELLYKGSKYADQISPEYINDIERFSPMHDIGKVGIRDKILLKPGKLDNEEFEEMKHHTVYGAEVLKTAEKNISKSGRSLFKLGIEIAENHHEKWNGSGYPSGKSEMEIPLSARIVAVADVFDALTSRRPYKEPFPFETSFEMLIEGSGKHFDPEIIKVLEKNKKKIYNLYKSFLLN